MALAQSDKDDIRTIIQAEVSAPLAIVTAEINTLQDTTARLQQKLENGAFVKAEEHKEQILICKEARKEISKLAETNRARITRILLALAGGIGAVGAGFGVDKLLGLL